MSTESNKLRNTLQNKRANLNSAQQQSISQQVAQILLASDYFRQSQHIAAYMAHRGEIDPRYIVEAIWQHGKQCYLPVVKAADQAMIFVNYAKTTELKPNSFGILEPVEQTNTIAATDLDWVLTPLVAFDKSGNRLGSGCGFYDRSFAFLKSSKHNKPLLVGLAYAFQQVERLSSNDWDVPLHAIATEEKLICNTG